MQCHVIGEETEAAAGSGLPENTQCENVLLGKQSQTHPSPFILTLPGNNLFSGSVFTLYHSYGAISAMEGSSTFLQIHSRLRKRHVNLYTSAIFQPYVWMQCDWFALAFNHTLQLMNWRYWLV